MATPRVLILARRESELLPSLPVLEKAGCRAGCVHRADHLASAVAAGPPDVVVLEWNLALPSEAMEIIKQCRDLHAGVLVVLEPQDLPTYDFTQGGADFLVVPVNPQELLARVRQTLWRVRGVDSQRAIRRGDLVVDQERYEVSLGGRPIFLTFKEYQLLALLASNPGRVYTREMLLSQVWGFDYFGGTRTVDVHIRRLRSKVEDADHTFIETVRNVGYRFRPEK